MSKFHSTVTRRDFMKGLGLAGAGLGAAAAATPVFHDLDELASFSASPWANFKRPRYITEREFGNPTTEIDWSIMQPWDWGYEPCNTHIANPGHGFIQPYGDTETQAKVKEWLSIIGNVRKQQYSQILSGIKSGTPGYALRDVALGVGATYLTFGRGPMPIPWGGPEMITPDDPDADRGVIPEMITPEGRGVPKWTGTPEEATNLLRAAAHFFGAANLGVVEFDANNKKFFYPKKTRFEDVDEPYQDGRVGVIPNKCRWGVYVVVRMPAEMTKRHLARQNVGPWYGYMYGPIILNRMQRFIKCLGYQAPGGSSYTAGGMNVPMGVMCGLSELGRTNHHITPEWGSMVRYTPGMPTDLPLAPTKPIDAGIWKFCATCKLCSDYCNEYGGGAQSMDDEPTYEVTGPWNRAGVKKYHLNWARCCFPGCDLNCGTVCVFNHHDSASIHEVIMGVVSTTPVLNSFFRSMEGLFYKAYRDEDDCAIWWDRDLRTWPYDNVLGGSTPPGW